MSLPEQFSEVDARLKKIRWQQGLARQGYERNRMSPELAEALRNEIRTALDAGDQPFDVTVARKVYDLAIAARDMCIAASGSVKEAIDQIKETNGPMETLQDPDAPEAAVQASESFGARLIRELLATLAPSGPRGAAEDPRALVHALAEARQRGMTDVAEELERKLFGKALPGPRPIDVTVAAVSVGSFEHGFSDGKLGAPPESEESEYKAGYLKGTEQRFLGAARAEREAIEKDAHDHSAAIDRDVRLGLTSEQIRDEIIAEVGMMADARTSEMQARYDAAVARGWPATLPRLVVDHGGRTFELKAVPGRPDDLNVYVCGCGLPIRQLEKEALDCPQRPPLLVTIGYEDPRDASIDLATLP